MGMSDTDGNELGDSNERATETIWGIYEFPRDSRQGRYVSDRNMRLFEARCEAQRRNEKRVDEAVYYREFYVDRTPRVHMAQKRNSRKR
jgi:hypothetical protein